LWLIDTLYGYPLHYAISVVDANATVDNYIETKYNIAWVPSGYYDGGYITGIGGSANSFGNLLGFIPNAGSREVTPFGLKIHLDWLGGGSLEVRVDLKENTRPGTPAAPTGITEGSWGLEYQFTTSGTDPDGDQLSYRLRYDSGDSTDWSGFYDSGETGTVPFTWSEAGTFYVRVQAKDSWGFQSGWSDSLEVEIHNYIAGDADGSGTLNMLDILYLIGFLYKGGPVPDPLDAGNADGLGGLNMLDILHLIAYLYKGGPPPVFPG
jgi:hypothetical protein